MALLLVLSLWRLIVSKLVSYYPPFPRETGQPLDELVYLSRFLKPVQPPQLAHRLLIYLLTLAITGDYPYIGTSSAIGSVIDPSAHIHPDII
jgi:hypothetical protein